jgi:hypothetical protein
MGVPRGRGDFGIYREIFLIKFKVYILEAYISGRRFISPKKIPGYATDTLYIKITHQAY